MVIEENRNNISIAKVELVFKREIVYHVMNTFLQTLTIVLVGYMTLFFELSNFNNRIMVTLTTILVLATMKAAITSVIHNVFIVGIHKAQYIF